MKGDAQKNLCSYLDLLNPLTPYNLTKTSCYSVHVHCKFPRPLHEHIFLCLSD